MNLQKFALVFYIMVFLTAMSSNATIAVIKKECQGEKMATNLLNNTITLQQALVLEHEEKNGIISDNIQAVISDSIKEGSIDGIQISNKTLFEDYRKYKSFLLLFPAKSINDLQGVFILSLGTKETGPKIPGFLSIRKAWMTQRGEKFSVFVEMKTNTSIDKHWAYTRYPKIRQVLISAYDDPNTAIQLPIFHKSLFPSQLLTSYQVQTKESWSVEEFVLPIEIIKQSKMIDRCEFLLEKLDRQFAISTGHFLQWSKALVTEKAIEQISSETEKFFLEKRINLSFNVTFESYNNTFTRKKKIRPLIQHPLTLIEANGEKLVGTIGISVFDTR